MSSINLTREEAQRRAELLHVRNYRIVLDLTSSQGTFESRTLVSFEALAEGQTFIDLRARVVHKVVLDDVDVTDTAVPVRGGVYEESQGIALDLAAGEHELVVEATIPYSNSGQGLHRFVDPEDDKVYLYTQFETADAKRMFACFDQPDLKATYDFEITAPKHWKVVTNAASEVTDAGEAKVHRSRIDYPLSTYLVAVCAGEYHEVSDEWTGTLTHHEETPAEQPHELSIPMSIYCRASLAKHLDVDKLFEQTKQGFDFYHANFGMAYPFGKYDQLFVPEFNMGAMENAGAVTFRDEYIFTSKVTDYRYERRCDTILHEMAHMWFGDLVTMQWWGDLWLNESFATWAAATSQAEATEFTNAWVTFANVEKSWALQQDQLPTTHPITADASDIETVEQNFDGITYAKGASVLKQLQAYVGRDAFFAGVRTHFATHAYGNATFGDLLEALESASGRDLSGWAGQWLKTTGVNPLSPNFEQKLGEYTKFEIHQGPAAPGAGELRTHRVAVGLYRLEGDQVRRFKRVEIDVEGAVTPVPELVGCEVADLVLVNDDDLTYCLMQLDEGSRDFVLNNIDKISDAMPRTLCWSAAWEATRAGAMRSRDFLALVERGARGEDQIAVLERVLLQARRALHFYADPTWARNEGRELLERICFEGARHAEPGSDKQLSFLLTLANLEISDSTASLFEQLLVDDTSGIPGVVVDTDLRWQLLSALIANGRVEGADVEKRIEELLAKDPTSAAKLFALKAHAAQPDPEVKRAVFDELADPANTMSNLYRRHKIEGLRAPASTHALQGLNDAIFESAESLWRDMSSEVALVTVTGLYPGWDISEKATQRAETFLERELPAGLRRVIAEGLADQQRALRNRAADLS
ncbi:aminopeptidase N [Corynebacterium gerontici]|uniref:aminopeptidase N n=1 Tax=Corynebacterium gerontici TaxID=2079234 RepID=UPI000F4FC486|nr:aminopeptidase N [Corynebacterium gerontici]